MRIACASGMRTRILPALVLLPAAAGALAAWQTEPEERAAFVRLASDEERKQFIEQFWLRRDPTPDTSENEYMVEHYRRIAYANQRFAWAGSAGWKTDRGRVYIVYGPPDEVESHPSGGQDVSAPWEAWRYRFLEGVGSDLIFKFIDRHGTREYRLVSGPEPPGRA
jgi:GWxTD domain-containing protein